MRFCILILLYSGWAFSQGVSQGIWSADNDNPPGLEEARASNYEKNHKPPTQHPPAYYTADYYEYQVDKNIKFKSTPDELPESMKEESYHATVARRKREEKEKYGSTTSYKIYKKKKCTYTCGKEFPKLATRPKPSYYQATWESKPAKVFRGANWNKEPERAPSSTPSSSTTKRNYTFSTSKTSGSYDSKSSRPITIQIKHKNTPSISKEPEGSNLR
ncbi:MAG: hypothetical protein EP319_11430 [Deltaproteobacteria bacterium]|nr:MAG: hypothetical protein EP319_11430 [Deltaproteobacteria bacterium]